MEIGLGKISRKSKPSVQIHPVSKERLVEMADGQKTEYTVFLSTLVDWAYRLDKDELAMLLEQINSLSEPSVARLVLKRQGVDVDDIEQRLLEAEGRLAALEAGRNTRQQTREQTEARGGDTPGAAS